MKLEKLSSAKFQKLTSAQMENVNGGWITIYDNQTFGISNAEGFNASGVYGYSSFLGIRTGPDEFRATDANKDTGACSMTVAPSC